MQTEVRSVPGSNPSGPKRKESDYRYLVSLFGYEGLIPLIVVGTVDLGPHRWTLWPRTARIAQNGNLAAAATSTVAERQPCSRDWSATSLT